MSVTRIMSQLLTKAAIVGTIALQPVHSEDVWVIVGSKCSDGSCASGPFYGQTDYDPFAAPTGVGGNPVLIAIGNKLRDAAKNFEPTCVPPGTTEQAHRAAQAALCDVKAVAEVSRALGIAASAVSADSARQACFAEIGEKLAVGDCTAQ